MNKKSPLNTSYPPSPCVRNCCLDDQDICLGCGRTLKEILAWHDASIEQKLTIIKASAQRLGNKNPRSLTCKGDNHSDTHPR